MRLRLVTLGVFFTFAPLWFYPARFPFVSFYWGIESSSPQGEAVHGSVLGVVLLLAAAAIRSTLRVPAVVAISVWIVAIFGAISLAGVSSARQLIFLAQTGVLVGALVAGAALGDEFIRGLQRAEKPILRTFWLVSLLTSAIYFSTPASERVLRTVSFLPPFRSYYAVVPVVLLLAGLTSKSVQGKERLGYTAVGLIALPTIWSRAALVGLVLLMLYFGIKQARRSQGNAAGAVLIIVGIAFVGGSGLAVSRAQDVVSGGGQLGNRLTIYAGAVHRILKNPVVGDGYALEIERRFSNGEVLESVLKPYTTHNQALEWALHIGLPGMALLMACFALAFRRLFRAEFRAFASSPLVGTFLVASAALGITHVPFSVVFPGCAAFAIVGATLGSRRTALQTVRNAEVDSHSECPVGSDSLRKLDPLARL